LGYAAGRKTTIDVTDLIWKRASMKSFSLFLTTCGAMGYRMERHFSIASIRCGQAIVAKTFPSG